MIGFSSRSSRIISYNETLVAKIVGLDESFFTHYLKEPTFFGVSYFNERKERGSESGSLLC